MIVYNVTVKVAQAIASDWLKWMKQEHIPKVLATKCFEQAKMFKLLEQDELEGPTYCIQYAAGSMLNYQRYIDTFSEELRKDTQSKWADGYIAFRSIMQNEDIEKW